MLSLSRSVSNISLNKMDHQKIKEDSKRVYQLNLKKISEANEKVGMGKKKMSHSLMNNCAQSKKLERKINMNKENMNGQETKKNVDTMKG
mmetsp:Transcript_28354/g.27294  ORF Transcript_28354/g.27294 Transcript_28354/m.27294 type:complete len:90 (-) Transcript_28354:1535-1804(-)